MKVFDIITLPKDEIQFLIKREWSLHYHCGINWSVLFVHLNHHLMMSCFSSQIKSFFQIHFSILLVEKTVCQWLAAGWWFSSDTPLSSANKTDLHDITEILLKVTLKPYLSPSNFHTCFILNYTLKKYPGKKSIHVW